jgi:hypothetical protein
MPNKNKTETDTHRLHVALHAWRVLRLKSLAPVRAVRRQSKAKRDAYRVEREMVSICRRRHLRASK